MKKAIFILVTIMLVTFSCNKEEVVEERACYEFTTTITAVVEYSDNYFPTQTLKETETEVICDLTNSDAAGISTSASYNGSFIEEFSSYGITIKATTTVTTTYKKLGY